ncbi:DUF2955 domain-containing protein [Vibrio sp. 10N.261.54.A5]|uniref:DUF2955 domain-containing protein n=1 Tax=Vibrio sp. 10N.261.54.A5 TaxID=3229686 RepID=UPI00354F33AE
MWTFENTAQGHSQRNEALRVALTVTICMVLGKLLNLDSPVYLALYPTIIMTKNKDYSWLGLIRTLAPTLLAASTALVVTEVFSQHPFVVWTISLFFFDFMRRRATTPAKKGKMLMPTFNWILIVVFAQHTTMDMPMRIHEILVSMLITMVVAKTMVVLFPVEQGNKPPVFKEQPVTFESRAISLALIGLGLAFLMIVDIISAMFCMVPVIAAATQTTHKSFIDVVDRRFQTQVGGCAFAVVFTLLMAGHQSTFGYYTIVLGLFAFMITASMAKAKGSARDIHADALLATMLPIQLYMTSSNLGLESTFLRAWELTVTLFVLWALCHFVRKPNGEEPALVR